MNKWHCPHCNDELLGSVNRCWRCGQRVTPPDFTRLVLAEEVTAPTAAELAVVVEPEVASAVVQVALTADDLALASLKEPPRRGSPFAFDTVLSGRPPQEPYLGNGPYQREAKAALPPVLGPSAALPTQYRQNQGAIGGVVASLLLGLASLAILPFSIFGFVTALIGVACGVWGMFHERKGVAISGLLLCCLALAISLYLMGFMLYDWLNPAGMTTPGGVLAP